MDCYSDTFNFSITNYLNYMIIRFYLLDIAYKCRIMQEIVQSWRIEFFALFWPIVQKDKTGVYDPSMCY